MSIQEDQLIFEYLGRVADAAQGRLAPLDRVQLVEDVRARIESERARGTPVARVIAQLGPAEVLLARSVVSNQSEDSVPAYTGLVVPDVSPDGDGEGGRNLPPWLRGVRTSRGSRGSRPGETPARYRRPRTTAGNPIGVFRGRNLLEIAALLFYTVGTLVLSYLGFIVAVGLTLMSKVWNEREKGVAIALVPALTLGAGIFVVWLTHSRSGTTGDRFDRAMDSLREFFGSWPWVAGFLAAGYLLFKLFSRSSGAPSR